MTRSRALALCAIFILSSHAAWAKPKVALTEIEGDGTGEIREAVVEALESKELSLIGSKDVNRAVDKLGDVADFTEKDLRKLASELEADAIVLGKFDKVGKTKTLKFRLFVGRKLAKGFTVSFKNTRSEKFRTLLHDKIVDKIGGAGGGDDDEDPVIKKTARKARTGDDEGEARPRKARAGDDEAEEARPRKASAGDDEEEARPTRKARPAADDDPAPAEDEPAERTRGEAEDDGDTEDEPRKARTRVATADEDEEIEDGSAAVRVDRPRTVNRAAARIDVGGSVLQRRFTFNTNVPDEPKGASLKPVGGARFATEIYPLAFVKPGSPLAGLGFGAHYDRTFTLKVRARGAGEGGEAGPVMAAPTKQSDYSIGLRYRMAFGGSETSPTLTVGVGFGKRLFSPDRSALDVTARDRIVRDTPNTHYTLFDPGLTVRVPVTRMVAFSLGARALLITDAGSIQSGTSYGRAKVYGGEGVAAVDLVFAGRYALRLSGEFAQIGFEFRGAGVLSNNVDMDPTTKDVGGMADRALGGAATLGVVY